MSKLGSAGSWMVRCLALLALSACAGAETESPVVLPRDGDRGADPFTVTLQFSPSHVHVGDVVTFNFVVEEGGAAVSSLGPQLAVRPVSGRSAEAAVTLTETSTPGRYAGKHVFWQDGSYALTFSFARGGVTYSRGFGISTHPHSE